MDPRPFGDGLCAAVRHYLHQNNKTHLGQINAEILADIAERYFLHHEAQIKAKKKRGDATEQERNIYLAYPRHIAPQDAYQAIRGVIERAGGAERLLGRVRIFAQCVSRWPESYRYPRLPDGSKRDVCPYPATWFRDGRWDDDEKEWMPAGMFTREDDPQGNYPARIPSGQSFPEPAGWLEEFPNSTFKDWKEVPTDSKKAICDHMNKVRA